MTITCTTTDAATQALAVLIDAGLIPGRHFQIAVSVPFGPPISYTIVVDLLADVLHQLRAVRDTTIT
jgi:hypothetical protein